MRLINRGVDSLYAGSFWDVEIAFQIVFYYSFSVLGNLKKSFTFEKLFEFGRVM